MEREAEERAEWCGFLQEEAEDLLCQGVKPWDEDAYLVLDALYDSDYWNGLQLQILRRLTMEEI